jgi:hypothetical protein
LRKALVSTTTATRIEPEVGCTSRTSRCPTLAIGLERIKRNLVAIEVLADRDTEETKVPIEVEGSS